MFSSYIKNIDTMANTSQPSTLPSRKKKPPPKPKLVNKLACPAAQRQKKPSC